MQLKIISKLLNQVWSGVIHLRLFGNINEIVNKCFFFIPLIGNGSHHIYLVNINDFTETLFKILKKNRVNKFVIHHKDTFAFRDIKKICIKKIK